MSNLNYLEDFSMFETKKAFDETVAHHLDRIRYDINETDRDVILMLSRYAVKYCGVAHLKVATIAKSIGKSSITIRRILNKLAKLGVIKKTTFMRKIQGGNGANIIVFLPFNPTNDKAEMIDRNQADNSARASDEVAEVADESINLLSNKELSTNNTYSQGNTTSYSKPYRQFRESIEAFIGQEDEKGLISRLYGVYLGQTKALRKAYDNSELIGVAIEGIRATFHATKRKKIYNIAGYFNGVLSNLLDDMGRELFAEMFV